MLPDEKTQPMSLEAFATLGDRRLAYVKAVDSGAVGFLYPTAPLLAPGHRVFVLHAADGTPVVIAPTRESALADAETYQLQPVSLH
jgi:hypothetical protein